MEHQVNTTVKPGSFLTRLLISERVVVTAILLNTIALFVLASVDDGSPAARVALAVDYACVVFFAVEAALKISVRSWAGYWASGWNRFDLIIVVLSSPMLLTPVIDLHELSVLLVLRLGRLFRLFRLLRFIPNRDHLIAGIRRSLRASVGILLALMLLNAILALGASFLFGRFAPEHFGNPALSLYSLFRVFTLEGWYEFPDLLAARAPHPLWAVLARLYFLGSVLAGGVVGLSLANAVFVDEMMMDNNSDLERKIDVLQEEIRSLKVLLTAQGAGAQAPLSPAGRGGSRGELPGKVATD
ncbi:MAG: ion transporter [Myxococcales bacterium]